MSSKKEAFVAFSRYGFIFNEEFSDFLNVCNGLNIFLSALGHGIVIRQATTLGEKVRLSEAIVSSLEEAGCSLGLQPHQISGLDWKALTPIAE